MTYRERRERRAARLRDWADKREQRAAATLRHGERFRGDWAFNTQPGHIPERARLIAREDRAHESLQKAASMSSRADEIERQAEHAIYSDDHDAIDRLRERIATLEAQRERIKAVNKAVRKYGLEKLFVAAPPFELTQAERSEFISLARLCPFHEVEKRGFPAYVLANLSGNISRQRARLAELERAREVTP